ncbi:hypothetical protein B0I37DRAFT_61124 [Chaetomium sp. MPI-CAGE-AT-0009]|nr:hypothetical protein B0I37DRAFT_61124 [Chaetomium sp. MPI-CAGE-AT-0009]
MQNHPDIRRSDSRIILVGHSMGGCVAKTAYILARQDPEAADIAGRMHSMFFLATPHRGSDMAAILENVLLVGWGKKPFVTDLTPNSAALSAINDSFRHFAPELRLWSFYGTLPMRGAGFMNRIVVDKHSGTLGYPKEEIAAMNADHRQVCKFESSADPNYKLLRNALATAVDLIRAATDPKPARSVEPIVTPREARSMLSSFLGVRDAPESDLINLQALKQPGSCQWLTQKPSFEAWRSGTSPGILWLLGRPGAGKSVLAGHVVEELQSSDAHCCYFFFKHGKGDGSSLHHCFRSLAFQMALQDKTVREAVLLLAEDGRSWDELDEAGVWRRLFTNCVFKVSSLTETVFFWVLDGVDECSDFNPLFRKRLLVDLPSNIRLFPTSRGLDEIQRGIASLGPAKVKTEILSNADTLDDIQLFVTTTLAEMGRLESDEANEQLCETIVKKSSGSFLWARLIAQELEDAWTKEAMEAVLNAAPADMFGMYRRMVRSIEGDRDRLVLGKSILTWVVLACRPLAVDELRCAVKLDTNQTLQNPAKAIPSLSGQLLFVDEQNRVQVLHETVREFLLAEMEDGLALHIDDVEDHAHLGSLLLTYLCACPFTDLPAVSRTTLAVRQRKALHDPKPVDTSLLDYACSFFAEHVSLSSIKGPRALLRDKLLSFLNSGNFLSWIEHMAASGNLSAMHRTANALMPVCEGVQPVHNGPRSIIDVVTKFRQPLLSCPSSIRFLIPPLCSPHSVISQISARTLRSSPFPGLVVKGLPPGTWNDDCIARLDFPSDFVSTVIFCNNRFVVGLFSGDIIFYDEASLQTSQELNHPERVQFLASSSDDRLLASSGETHLIVWDIETGVKTHSFPLHSKLIAVTFIQQDAILAAFNNRKLARWSLISQDQETISWADFNILAADQSLDSYLILPPTSVAFLDNENGALVALGCDVAPIFICGVDSLRMLGSIGHEMMPAPCIEAMAFHPDTAIPVLLVSYRQGDFCVFDYTAMTLRHRQHDLHASTIACTLGSRCIVVGSAKGFIEAYYLDYDGQGPVTLKLVYHSRRLWTDLVGTALSPRSWRFVDSQRRQVRVWAPAALADIRSEELNDKTNDTREQADIARLDLMQGRLDTRDERTRRITSPLVPAADGRFIVAGMSNADVVLFSSSDAVEAGVMYEHKGRSRVTRLVLDEPRRLVVSANSDGRVLVVELQVPLDQFRTTTMGPKTRIIQDLVFTQDVMSLLINPAGDRLLACGRAARQLWELPSGSIIYHEDEGDMDLWETASPSSSSEKALTGLRNSTNTIAGSIQSAFQHPTNPAWFVLMIGDVAKVCSWSDFTEISSPEGKLLLTHPWQRLPDSGFTYCPPCRTAGTTSSFHVGSDFVVELFQPLMSSSKRIFAWPSTAFDPFSGQMAASPALEPTPGSIGFKVMSFLGFVGSSTLIFVDVDLWACSVDLQSMSAPAPPHPGGFTAEPVSAEMETTIPVRRHFFALSEWRVSLGNLRCAMVVPPARLGVAGGGQDIVAFAVKDQIVVYKGGLQFSEGLPC